MPGDSAHDPIHRPTARVLLLDSEGRTLLFTAVERDQDTGLPFWFPPGGGVEEGETHEQAAQRELMEETGLSVPIGPCIWLRDHTVRMMGQWYHAVERYYLARTPQSRISVDSWTELEVRMIQEYRWWSLEEIQASGDIFVPRQLGTLLPPILAGQVPTVPLEVGV